jgi:hypothetical protein
VAWEDDDWVALAEHMNDALPVAEDVDRVWAAL